jgi:tetratricopeptide (TPR) repeat protein
MVTTTENLAQGMEYHRAGDLDRAEQVYRQVIGTNPDQADALHLLGVIAHQRGQHEQAVRYIEQALASRPGQPRYYSHLGLAYQALGRWEEALASQRRAVSFAPDWAEAHNNLGVVLATMGRDDQAIGCYSQALWLQADYAEARYNRANVLCHQGKLDEAIADYREALRLQPKSADFHNNLGNALFQQGRLEEAVASFRAALELAPNLPLAHHNLGKALLAQGHVDEAIRCQRQAAALSPGDAEAQTRLGEVLLRQGELQDAIACFRRVVVLSPGRAEAHFQLGMALASAKGLDEAKACFAEVLRLQPDYAQARYHLANILLEQDRLEEAGEQFREALRLLPDSIDILNNLGSVLFRQGKASAASAYLERALTLRPGFALAHRNLGQVYMSQKKWAEAGACFQKTIELQSDSAESHRNLGTVLFEQGRREEALACFRRSRELQPGDADTQNNLGAALLALGKEHDEAIACFQEALRLRPDYARALHNLSDVLLKEGRAEEAVSVCRRAVALEPDNADALNRLGVALAGTDRLEEAAIYYEKALRLAPTLAIARANIGNLLLSQGRTDEAMVCMRKALTLAPDSADTLINLGNGLRQQHELREAAACYDRALDLKPDFPDAHWNRAQVWLLMGDFERGWPEAEWRWKLKIYRPPPFRQPVWDGSSLTGKTILLHVEQGAGDTLQFVRYAPLVKQQGGKVILACQGPLAKILASCPGVDLLLPDGASLVPFDVYATLMSLPRIFKTTLDSVPANVPYLFADPELIDHWQNELRSVPGFKIAIAWQGNVAYSGDRQRSVPLAYFSPLAKVPGVRLLSLQKGHGSDQLQYVDFNAMDLGSRLDERAGAFMDTAAVMKNVDLVITSDTSVAHLAGALGVPTWLAVCYSPDWRWLLDREDCPWYPNMRLFRQDLPGDWPGVFARMESALRERLGLAETAKHDGPADARSKPTYKADTRSGRRATVCILTYGDYREYFGRCLDSVLEHTPLDQIELRLGFNDAESSFAYAWEKLGAREAWPELTRLPADIERFTFHSPLGMKVLLWKSPVNLYKEPMARLLYHNVVLDTEYAIWLDDDSYVEEGWWPALCQVMDRQIDYSGQSWWADYFPGQTEMIKAQPWYRNLPFDLQDGKPGIRFMTGGFVLLRSERIRQADFPDTTFTWNSDTLKQYGGDTLLGEIARQLGWTRVVHEAHIKVNVDMQGNHPAPRRGGTGRQFGSEVDVAIS